MKIISFYKAQSRLNLKKILTLTGNSLPEEIGIFELLTIDELLCQEREMREREGTLAQIK